MKITSISILICVTLLFWQVCTSKYCNCMQILSSSGQQPFDILYRFISILYQAVLSDNHFVKCGLLI